MMFEAFFINTIFVVGALVIAGAGFRFLCTIVEKFIVETLPIVIELYARYRYPNNFHD